MILLKIKEMGYQEGDDVGRAKRATNHMRLQNDCGYRFGPFFIELSVAFKYSRMIFAYFLGIILTLIL